MRALQAFLGAFSLLAFGQSAHALLIATPAGFPAPPAHLVTFNELPPTGDQGTAMYLGPNLIITTSRNFDVINTNLFGAASTFPDFVGGPALGIRPGSAGGNITLTFLTPVSQAGLGIFDPNFNGTMVQFFGIGDNVAYDVRRGSRELAARGHLAAFFTPGRSPDEELR